MNNYWVSWWHRESMGNFNLHSPWWSTGRVQLDGDVYISISALIQCEEGDILDVIRRSYEIKSFNYLLGCLINWRFVIPKPEGWRPPKDRFPIDKTEASGD